MALQIFADGIQTYDSRAEEYALEGLKTTTGLNKGGTAEIVMPPGHPGYNAYTSYRTVVELYENGVLQFRGRALYPSDDFYNTRTIVCEGERCFLRDGIMRPYLYQDSPAAIFADALAKYNAQVDGWKQFSLGQVTVTDANDYVRLENQSAETCLEFFDKLVERCGGYIVFSDDGNGGRAINWLAEINTECTQPIEFGENLLEFARSGETNDLATVLVPYGAQKEDGTRVTIESVNGGRDWIEDADAVALRGRICATNTWDDVTDPANLLTKARAWLREHRLAVTSLQLTAADLSVLDRSLDSFNPGVWVPVKSGPHLVNDHFQVTDRERNWLEDNDGQVTLGKSVQTLTGADAMASRETSKAGNIVLQQANANAAALVFASQEVLTSKIEQLADSITLEVSGSLGNSAAIRLSVNGEVTTETLDLSAVRRAFADDTSAVTISAGTITFNSGTLIVNSGNFTLDEEGTITAKAGTVGGWTLKNYKLYAGDGTNIKTVAVQAPTEANLYVFAAGGASHDSYADCPFRVTKAGKLYATDAVIYGDIITIDGSYMTELDRGSLRLYYDDALCGTINTKYWSGASGEGISLRIEEGGNYIMFSHPSTAGTGYDVDYYLNYGWSSNYDEKHIFQTSARFLSDVYLDGKTDIGSLRLRGPGGKRYLVTANDNGSVTCSLL